MKTFKLYSISVLEGQDDHKVKRLPIKIEDGLIINMENKSHTWYIDAVMSREHLDYFYQLKDGNRHALAEVVITSKDNHPAAMITKVKVITELSEHISILFEAKLVQKKDDSITSVLKSLMDEGYENKELLEKFNYQIKNDGEHVDSSLESLYKELQQDDQYHLN